MISSLYLNYPDLAEMCGCTQLFTAYAGLWCGNLSEQSWIIMQKIDCIKEMGKL